MPLWKIYANPSTFTPTQRAGLAKAITDLYVNQVGLPAFYVNVLFVPLDDGQIYVGGVANKNFVRITAEQIARQMPDTTTEDGRAFRRGWMDTINEVFSCD